MPFILALDQGTTSSRALVFDQEGKIVALAQSEFKQIYPRTAWVEHDPRDIWETQKGVAEEALRSVGLNRSDVAAIGITNQRETTVVWDRATGEPVYNAIVWQDRRTAGQCQRLIEDGVEPLVRERTGLVIDAYFSATKIAWILDNVEGARKRAEAGELLFGTVDTWLAWKLTEGRSHITDATNASRTLLYNIRANRWDDELLKIFNVPRAMLPEVRNSSEHYADALTPVLAGVPVAGIAGDQQAALFGQACLSPGLTKNTYGTGCFMLQNTGDQALASRHRLVTTIASQIGGRVAYAFEGSVFIGGAVVQWLRDGLGIIKTAPEIEGLAASVEDNGGVYMVPAFAGLGAPHWDPNARGTILGITRGTTAGHFARAALESIAYQVADLLDAMRNDSGQPITELRVDGGAAVNNALMQFQSDILGVPLVRPKITETTALGAAYLAGLAVGFWRDTGDVSSRHQVERRFEPKLDASKVEQLRENWRRALGRSKDWQSAAHA